MERQRRRAAWLFLLPMLIVLAGVAGWPLFRTVFFSFTDATLATLDGFQGVGLDNYLWLLRDPVWWRAVRNTLVFTVVSVGIETALGLGIALILNAHLPGRGLLRAAVLIPWAIPTVVSAQMWGWMFHDLYGVVNAALMGLGVIAEPRAWTADPDLALPVVIAVDVWKSTPFMALLILAALQMLPRDLYEAARVDGVHPVKVFLRITLPLIRPALMVAVLFRTLDALRVFDLMYVLTGNSRSTMSMSVYARQYLIDFQDVGYGSAAATLLVLVLAVATVLAVTLGRVRVDAGR
ncbi:ABC transporter permease (plasmid) [Azospirillum argentinense]|uniref:ABC transporter permease n=2 Tax=Azospirillum argentinense TaxID=2970906 RepID=A0A060DQD5_9PROT|nr:ABC transporter permease [Azospirillum argentinense]EZQ04466.1 ABC transporter permease [Azospirillum argentinense]